MTELGPLRWGPRWPPLTPEFAVGRGAVSGLLGRALLGRGEGLAAYRGLVSSDALAVTGPELPWVDGVEYFGRDGACAWLLVPTARCPSTPTAWAEHRFREAHGGASWPCLWLPPPTEQGAGELLPVGNMAPFDVERLRAWCEGRP